MFKKLYVLCCFVILFSLQACAQEAKWQEGTHYKVIRSEASASPQVIEFFSFWCPHCLSFEPIVTDIKRDLDDKVEFKKVHVNFMRFTSAQIQNAATRAMLIGRELGKEEEVNTSIFKYIQLDRNVVTGFNDLRGIFIASGMTAEEFDKLATNFKINSQLMKNNNIVDEYKNSLSGVPSFVVNGKYLTTFTAEMNPKDIVELINYLTTLK